ncbi:heme exporter protein CcmD [Comamonas sp.]
MIYWHSWSEFIHMGGYGGYVWGSLGIMALVMVAEVWQIRTRRRRLG